MKAIIFACFVALAAARVATLSEGTSEASLFAMQMREQTPFYLNALTKPDSPQFMELMELLIPNELAELDAHFQDQEGWNPRAFISGFYNKYKCAVCGKVVGLVTNTLVGDPNKIFASGNALACAAVTKVGTTLCPKVITPSLTAALASVTAGLGAAAGPAIWVAAKGVCGLAGKLFNAVCLWATNAVLKKFPAAKAKVDAVVRTKAIQELKRLMQPVTACRAIKLCGPTQTVAWPSKVTATGAF